MLKRDVRAVLHRIPVVRRRFVFKVNLFHNQAVLERSYVDMEILRTREASGEY